MRGSPALGRRADSRHLYEIDILRILTFACVIAVHTTSHTISDGDLPLFAVLALVHFTREAFFALTAFVLVYSWLNRPRPMREFWPKRFLLVGVPYLVWSAIYVLAPYLRSPNGDLLGLAHDFVVAALTGDAWYHLYFLLVTMQVYLLLPVILWLVRRTRRHHVAVLVIALIIQLGVIGAYSYIPAVATATRSWIGSVFLSYVFVIVAGAIAADHQVPFLSWVRAHRPGIALVTIATGALFLAWCWAQHVWFGFSYAGAATAFQPAVVVWGTVISVAFLAIGTRWADRRRADSRPARFVDWASDRSFGIFLAHPLIIWLVLWVGGGLGRLVPTPWLTLVVYLLAVGGAALISDLARRTPASLALAGRPFRAKTNAAKPRTRRASSTTPSTSSSTSTSTSR